MSDHDPNYQTAYDGPLSDKLKGRFENLREKSKAVTLSVMAPKCGFSISFLGSLLRKEGGASIRTRHIARFVRGLEQLEEENGILYAEKEIPAEKAPLDLADWLETLVRVANEKGFAVSFSPLAK